MKVLHIQIARSEWRGKDDKGRPYNDLLKITEGDINGSLTCHNITKAEAMNQISDWIDSLFKKMERRDNGR